MDQSFWKEGQKVHQDQKDQKVQNIFSKARLSTEKMFPVGPTLNRAAAPARSVRRQLEKALPVPGAGDL